MSDDEYHDPDPTCYGCQGTGSCRWTGSSMDGKRCPCTYPEYWKED